MHQNVSVIEGLIASALEFEAQRNRVVYSELNFPSVMYVWEAQRRRGARIVTVPSRDGVTIAAEDLLAAIDERTLIVPMSTCCSRRLPAGRRPRSARAPARSARSCWPTATSRRARCPSM